MLSDLVLKLNARVALFIKYWASGTVFLVVAWASFFLLQAFSLLAWALGFAAIVVYFIAVPYVLGRIIMRMVALQIFSEELTKLSTRE